MGRKTFRKKITSDEITEQIREENKELMGKFLKHKSIKLSEKSLVVYESNLLMFFTWNYMENGNKKFTEIKKLEFSDFFVYLSDDLKLGSARLNNMRSTLSSFSSFIEKFYDEEYPNFRNVILNVVDSAPKEMRREKTVLTDEQIEDLLTHMEKLDAQKACWLALAITSGARFSELLRFETDLIDENRTAFGDLFLETTRKIKTKGRGKSGKMIHKYILRDKFLPYYKAWLEERNKILVENNQTHNKLFVKLNGEPATTSTVRSWVRQFEEYLGVPLYAHCLRHYLVTLFSKKNIPQNLIKELMGWESITMVEIYNDETLADKDFPELENLRL